MYLHNQNYLLKFILMKALFIPLFLVLFSAGAIAQEKKTTPAAPVSNALANQFNNLKGGANSYRENGKDYKVVDVDALNDFWKNVQLTLEQNEQKLLDGGKQTRSELSEAKTTITEQQKQLQLLKTENAQKEQQVQASTNAINNISFFGFNMSKQFYVILTSILIVGLLVMLAAVLAVYKRSKVVTDAKQRASDEMEQELTECKKTSRERELKLKRELQTEMNRVEELAKQVATLQRQHH